MSFHEVSKKCLTLHQISIAGDVIALQSHVTQQLDVAKGSLAHSAYQTAKIVAGKVTGPYGK